MHLIEYSRIISHYGVMSWTFYIELALGIGAIAVPIAFPQIPPLIGYALFAIAIVFGILAIRSIWLQKRISQLPNLLMKDAIKYIWKASRWARTHETDAQWYMTIQTDVRDALRLGHVTAYGRPLLHGQIPAGFPGAMEKIPTEHWANYRPEIFDALLGNATDNYSCIPTTGEKGYYDIHFDKVETKHKWRKMSFIEKLRHKNLVLS